MNIDFNYSEDKVINIDCPKGVFVPNITTRLLIEAVYNLNFKYSNVLDLGCGSGALGASLCKEDIINTPIFASDLSEIAVETSKVNFSRYGYEAIIKAGSLFEPWKGMRFDLIIDDISGISEAVASISPWFQGIPCISGDDGSFLVNSIINESPDFLSPGGIILFPLLSLSNTDSILSNARQTFKKVNLICRKEWPLPAEMHSSMAMLKNLRDKGNIQLIEKFGMFLCYTEIYCASEPR
jgi:methylase of polypeptide subunit release factors